MHKLSSNELGYFPLPCVASFPFRTRSGSIAVGARANHVRDYALHFPRLISRRQVRPER